MYHLRANLEACRILMAGLREPGFVKASFMLREVPEAMTKILAVRDPRFVGFQRLRLFSAGDQNSPAVFEEGPDGLDLYLNREGVQDFSEALRQMSEGNWDFSDCGIWFWGALSYDAYRARYG